MYFYTRPRLRWFFLIIFLLLGVYYSLIGWSSFPLNLKDVFLYLFNFNENSIEQQIIATTRSPRTLSALIIGANLAVAGLLMQGLTRNTLASPSVLGINAGAACFMALSNIGVNFISDMSSLVAASLGAVMSGGVVLLLGGFFSPRANPLKLILAGIAINALLVGLTRAAVIIADDKAYSVINWLSGSLANLDWAQWQLLWPTSLIGLFIAISVSRNLNLLALGNEMAVSLGVNIALTRILSCIAIVLLTASSVSIAGPIGFVGLLIPHIARRLVENNFLLLLPTSAILGSSLMLWADVLSRAIAFPAETPVGVITALLGAPCFIGLAIRNKSA